MKSLLFYTFLFVATGLIAQVQNPFFPIAEQTIELSSELEVDIPFTKYETFELDNHTFKSILRNIPLESTQKLKNSLHTLRLPTPNGSRQFKIVESSVMQANLQARWPQLRTYRLLDVDNPLYNGRMSVTPQGITAVFKTDKGDVFIEPYAFGQDRYHIVYFERDFELTEENNHQLSCGYTPEEHENLETEEDITISQEKTTTGAPAQIIEYKLALTCTGEYAQNKGGTVESVLASFVTATNLANATFEQEVGVRVVLIEQEESLVFLHPATDPFVNADNGGQLLSQVNGAIVTTAGIPFAVYDMGHLFTAGCTDVGGVVSGRVCTGGKDRAVTCHSSNNIGAIVRRIMTHEVAHQFSVGHTFSNCPGNEGQTAGSSAFEPGSGSTIMSYAGACGDQNIQFNSDNYYHAGSLDQFIFYTRQGTGSSCSTVLPATNTEPDVILDYVDGFYIPKSTPFELDGHATDADGDVLTYCWEEMDLGVSTPLGAPQGNAPLFRSFPPKEGITNRYFPRIQDIINNNEDNREVLPFYSRDLNFRFTVRDNNSEIGATKWKDVSFYSTTGSGPFLVLEPNEASVAWTVGDYKEVRWDVANTDNDVVNCQLVNIRLSMNGGLTYPIMLESEVPNTGSAFVTVPDEVGSNMRIRVEAAHNIFFDISNENFAIQQATAPTYTLSPSPVFQQICLPAESVVDFTTGSILGYDSLITLSIVSELPTGLEATFSNESILPGETSQLNLDFNNLENYHQPLSITVSAVAPSQDTFYRTIILDIIDNDFEELELLTPEEGEAGININADFTWVDVNNALTYEWQLSNDAAFNNIIASAQDLEEASYTPSNIQFDANELYFWRVRPTNECGQNEWRAPHVFHTTNSICSPTESTDTPVNIPGTGTPPTRMSVLTVPFDGVINDINISYVNVSYQPIQNFRISLISPSNTEVLLYDQSCFSTDIVNIGFDDEAPNNIICPPDGQFTFRPVEPLAAFIGENSAGEWTLKVKVLETGFGSPGQIGDWQIEFCADGNAVAPTLLTNNTLFVPPLMSNPVSHDLLNVTDAEQGPDELTYTLVSTPGHGQLYLIDQELVPGSTFTQATIDAFNLVYVNTNGDAAEDAFTFVVEDGTGGFLPIQRFNIVIDPNAPVATEDLIANQPIRLYPNPAYDKMLLEWDAPTNEVKNLKVFNVHGQVLYQASLPKASINWEVSVNEWPNGVYFVQLGSAIIRMIKQ